VIRTDCLILYNDIINLESTDAKMIIVLYFTEPERSNYGMILTVKFKISHS